MPRKGSNKLRTGCITCKIRKIKCDERKPHCNRCTTTGRKCDGYTRPRLQACSPAGAETGSAVSSRRPSGPFQAFSQPGELRALQLFCEVVAPSVSKPYSLHLWKNLVVQLSSSEPAVRHSIVAISSLYEDFYSKTKSIIQLRDNSFALSHYNLAIRNVTAVPDEALVLLVCLLFVCIESFQGNPESALRHMRHGLQMLQNVQSANAWVRDYIGPVFRRLSIVPLYFGMEAFVQPPGLHDVTPAEFAYLDEAGYFIEGILVRTIQFSRNGYHHPYMSTEVPTPISADLLIQQADLLDTMLKWRSAFAAFEMRNPSTPDTEAARCSFMLQVYVCEIWATVAFTPGEGTFDNYTVAFRRITRYAKRMGRAMCPELEASGQNVKTFRFEMGYLPILVYVISKCRELITRVEALGLMKRYGSDRESLWDKETLYLASRRLVETEHKVLLDDECQPLPPVDWDWVPPAETRIEDLASFLPQQQ